ncbi:FadR/GntR family transcriptional regulator [uncultured Paracoccus sp.]|uniref:FadR/GntR family transcriptional regulator n=1 Tax=uncultured Paracoccus sp. TaxID=189685 RepID=UPI0025D0F04C|nr:FadR/GntR family transcriptional regulator [uncultured Paracoccus sp.]
MKPSDQLVGPDPTTRLVERIRRLIADGSLANNARLPPERILSAQLGVSRVELRRALAVLAADGLIWRHVGRGTFVGTRPVHDLNEINFLRQLANPDKLLEARTAIEPELARLAAIHASRADIDTIRDCCIRGRMAPDWRSYEAWDSKLHHAIATATHNKLLIFLFDSLNVVRRSIVWKQRRDTVAPPSDHFSFDQHDAMAKAIAAREPDRAAAEMRAHLHTVAERMMPIME